ncbi:MAG: ribose-phosphate diphosphokinase [Ilumatobacteraceae bacterium]
MREIVVFSGNAHPSLAERICGHLGVPVSPVDVQRFSNDCLQVQLGANCRQRDVYLVQPLVPPTQEHLMELLLMLDAARGASAAQVTAVIPHFAYARSDKKDASRISIGGRLVADLLITAGASRVITMALHAPQVHGFFGVVPVDHLTAIGELAEHFRGSDLTNAVVVSPDLGNAKTASQFARLLGVPVAAGSKQRLADDTVVIGAIVGDVAGKRAIVLDDEIATGGSIVELIDRLDRARMPRGLGGVHARVVLGWGRRAAAWSRASEGVRHHRHGAVTAGLARAPGALGGDAVRRGDPPQSPRRIREQPLRRRRSRLRPTPTPPPVLIGPVWAGRPPTHRLGGIPPIPRSGRDRFQQVQ